MMTYMLAQWQVNGIPFVVQADSCKDGRALAKIIAKFVEELGHQVEMLGMKAEANDAGKINLVEQLEVVNETVNNKVVVMISGETGGPKQPFVDWLNSGFNDADTLFNNQNLVCSDMVGAIIIAGCLSAGTSFNVHDDEVLFGLINCGYLPKHVYMQAMFRLRVLLINGYYWILVIHVGLDQMVINADKKLLEAFVSCTKDVHLQTHTLPFPTVMRTFAHMQRPPPHR